MPDIVPVGRDSRTDVNSGEPDPTEDDLELFALRMIKSDPFTTISEIRRELGQRPSGGTISWWQVFLALKKNRLLRRRSRFRYAWGRT